MLKVIIAGASEKDLKELYSSVKWEETGCEAADISVGEKDTLSRVKGCDYDVLICFEENFRWESICKTAKEYLGHTDLILLCKNKSFALAEQALRAGATGIFAASDIKSGEISGLLKEIYQRRKNSLLISQFFFDEQITEQIYFHLNGNDAAYFEELFDKLGALKEDKEIIRAVCVKLMGILYDYLEHRGFKNAGLQRGSSVRKIGEIPYISEVIKYAKDRYINIFQFETEKNQDYYSALTQSIKEYILNNYAGTVLDVPKIAERFHFSANYINGIFKGQTGETIPSFITNLRLGRAKKLLTETKMPISEISAIVGYSRLTYFSRIFKRKYNISPIEYRNKFSENT